MNDSSWNMFKEMVFQPDDFMDTVTVGILVVTSPLLIPFSLVLYTVGKAVGVIAAFFKKVWDNREPS
jgi:hypothetical protein